MFKSSHRHAGAVFGVVLVAIVIAVVTTLSGQQPRSTTFIPNGMLFPNAAGNSQTLSSLNGGLDLTNPFFQELGTNGRSCATCHEPGDGMSVSAAHIQQRFVLTDGRDPIFRTADGSTCNHDVDVSTLAGRTDAYRLLRTRGLIRVALSVPANADYQVTNVDNPYGCNEADVVSMYRRPLPATNLRFLTTVMWDGRESSAPTGTVKILPSNYPSSLVTDLEHQSVDATKGHAQGDGSRPTPSEQQQIVNFEMALTTAQAVGGRVGSLSAQGAAGGPGPLAVQPFFVGMNSSVNFLLPAFEQPGGLTTPGDGQFTPNVFETFAAWAGSRAGADGAAIARGQALFDSKPITITGVAGINDDVRAGGLFTGGLPSLVGSCGTCHDTPNVGNHSFPTPLDIGTGDPAASTPSANLGGLDIAYLPRITVCRTDQGNGEPSLDCRITTDLGQALVDGRFDHVGKIKGPILRGLSARAPYFHNGSANTLLDVLRFYEKRFGLSLTAQEESDLVAFLSAL